MITAHLYFLALSIGCGKYPEKEYNIDVNGVNIKYYVRGKKNGKPIVLLHGNGGSHRSMLTQAKQLARAGYLVYSPDSRGHGANAPLQEYHYADMAEDMSQFIHKLGLKKPAIYGWSDGGIIALMLEMAYPGICSSITASGANLYPDCGENFECFKQWILEHDSPITRMMLSEPDIAPKSLAEIKCPTLITCGSDDVISVEHTKLIADSIPGSELAIFEGEDHGSYIKKSPKMGKRLLEFFRKIGY